MLKKLAGFMIVMGVLASCTQPTTTPPPSPPSEDIMLSGTVHAPAGKSVSGTLVVACYVQGDDCDEEKSGYAEVKTSGASASFAINGLEAKEYLLFAIKDANNNGALGDEGDYLAVYGRNGVVRAPKQGLKLELEVVSEGTKPPTPGPNPNPEPNSVSGVALDWQGEPLANARVWIEPALTTGLVEVRTDAQGRYSVKNLPSVPYYASAYAEVSYNAQTFCLRLGMPSPDDYSAFTPENGVVRNFQLQLTGPIIDQPGNFFGGTFRVYKFGLYKDAGSAIEFTFSASGQRIDGSNGVSFTYTAPLGSPDHLEIKDIPVGPYLVSATLVGHDGSRTPINMGPDIFEATFETVALGWFAASECYKSSGVLDSFVWLANPGE